MHRRRFLASALALGLVPFAPGALAARLPAELGSSGGGGTQGARRLVVIFLRGGVDGLSVLAPYDEPNYRAWRPNLALPLRGEGALQDLDGRFGLHPALTALLPFWRDGTLAFVHACGSPDPSRSHFEAQDNMETGTPGVKTTTDGWMNRLLAELATPSPETRRDAPAEGVRAVSFGPALPRILRGREPAVNVPVGRAAGRPQPSDHPAIAPLLDRLYAQDPALGAAWRTGKVAHAQMRAALADEMAAADRQAPGAARFAALAEQAARLMAREPEIRLAFLAVGGFDTHVNQGAAEGALARRLRPLGEGLARFVTVLGKEYEDTAIVVLSEFGRTVRENGNGGTDHGHGNVLWLLGGRVRGGRVYGTWPGLEADRLYEGRDLAVTTDFRTVLSAVLRAHFGLDTAALARVFPGFRPPAETPALLA